LNKEMEKGRNNILFTPSGCLTEKALALYTRGLLSEEETSSVNNHMQGCEMCAYAADGYLLAGPEAFAEDLIFVNSGVTDLSLNEAEIRESTFAEESHFEGPRFPVMSHEEIKQFTGDLKAKAAADQDTPVERNPEPIILHPGKKIFHRYQFRLMAAAILLLVGFGSILLYFQFKHSTVDKNTAELIEKSDTISRELTSIGKTAGKKTVSEKKDQPGPVSVMEEDTEREIIVNDNPQTSSPGYANRPVAGLIDRSSYTNREGNALAPTLGMPQGATPGAPQGTSGNKTPKIPEENEIVTMSVSSDQEETIPIPVNMDEGASQALKMKSANEEAEIMEAEIFTVVEESPHYPGGDEMRIKFLQENIKYPQAARESSLSGLVYITFIVETDGTITNIRVLRGIGGGCDEEAVRVIKLMPKWTPGKQRGKPVRVQFSMPVQFKLAG